MDKRTFISYQSVIITNIVTIKTINKLFYTPPHGYHQLVHQYGVLKLSNIVLE